SQTMENKTIIISNSVKVDDSQKATPVGIPTTINMEEITLIWFDEDIRLREDIKETTKVLRQINDCIIFHDDKDKCIKHIKSIQHEKILFISTCESALDILNIVHHLSQIHLVFLLSTTPKQYEHLLHEYSKIVRIFEEQHELINSIKQNIDLAEKQMQTFSFYDQNQNLAQKYEELKTQQTSSTVKTLYRGLKLSDNDFHKLKQYEGKLISANGFFSTSGSKQVALMFASESATEPPQQSVLFEIQCGIPANMATLADISEISNFHSEEEVLFDLGAIFLIQTIEPSPKSNVWVIKMKETAQGASVVRDYKELNKKAMQKHSAVIIFGDLLTNMGQYAKAQTYFESLLASPNREDISWIYHKIATAHYRKGEYEQSLQYSLRAQETNMNDDPTASQTPAHIITDIASVYFSKADYDQTSDSHPKALRLAEIRLPPNHDSTAASLMTIGNIYYSKGDSDQALQYSLKSLRMHEIYLPPNHDSTAASLINIGNIYYSKGDSDQALQYSLKSLRMHEICLPPNHDSTAASLRNIANNYRAKADYDQALEYSLKSLRMQEI
ncbi:unnamed protein product, partial [Didymodactylos carnosus]